MTVMMGAAGVMAIPSASWLKIVTLGADGVYDRGFSSVAPTAGSISFTNRVGNKVATRFMYSADTDEFNFQIDETNPGGFTFTTLVVESIPGFTTVTLNRAAAVEYSGFPIRGWIWSSVGLLWAPADVGEDRKIWVQR